ncbi:MAG: SDR family NAD(P)-dependent oxidoreductase [Proteobacteria bacterium]|nr:SDR family NAD(P)-dependent oxidoreductase [Pseudomonadota bacterium]
MELSNKTIVITGASKGLGKETALRLCRQNTNLVLVARTENLLKQTQKEIDNLTGRSPLIIPCDVSNESDVERMSGIIKTNFHHVDVLINNAGIGIHKISEDMSSEEMRKQFEVNFYGPVYCIKALLPLLKLSDSPYILNIGSLVGEISFADNSIYAATKSALSCFSDGLRSEMVKSNIRVGLFLPGLMSTSFQNDRERKIKTPSFMILDPQKVAAKLERVIHRRKKKVYVHKWMLFLMKMKKLYG